MLNRSSCLILNYLASYFIDQKIKRMTNILNCTGFIKGVTYQTFLNESLRETDFDRFNINQAKAFGLIKFESPKTEIAYSKWVTPKRTRSYPFARIYNTYNSCKAVTVIPVLKDEGKNGERDRIQFNTISWMNLLNIYIVLAYYDTAEKSFKKGQEQKHKLTNQKFNNEFVKSQIEEIVRYRQSALHWNKNLFETRFTEIFTKALESYDNIAQQTGVLVHSRQGLDKYVAKIERDFSEFANISLKGSQNASRREAFTSHSKEHLVDGQKATFSIENYLGGIYYLTPDEVFCRNDIYIIQESKNASGGLLPSIPDVQDGLFKLILFSNLDSLTINQEQVQFISKLKLTGKNIIGSIQFPQQIDKIDSFLENNSFKRSQIKVINNLALESQQNKKLIIEITGNSPIKSPLRYPGGKSKAVNTIINYLPINFFLFQEYREPFVGGGSLFICLKQKYPHLKIWINDLNTELYLFWKIAQNNLAELVKEIFEIKRTCLDGKQLFKELSNVDLNKLSHIERAVRFFVLNRITFSGTVESGGFSQQAFTKRFTLSSIHRLEKLEHILSDVKITNLDYSCLLQSQNKTTFLYLDPPYFSATKSKLYGKRGELHISFNHQKFSENIKKCSCPWLISYDNCLEIKNSFRANKIYEWELQYGMNNYKQGEAAKGKELIITNFNPKKSYEFD